MVVKKNFFKCFVNTNSKLVNGESGSLKIHHREPRERSATAFPATASFSAAAARAAGLWPQGRPGRGSGCRSLVFASRALGSGAPDPLRRSSVLVPAWETAGGVGGRDHDPSGDSDSRASGGPRGEGRGRRLPQGHDGGRRRRPASPETLREGGGACKGPANHGLALR